jgi:hypothetical protein
VSGTLFFSSEAVNRVDVGLVYALPSIRNCEFDKARLRFLAEFFHSWRILGALGEQTRWVLRKCLAHFDARKSPSIQVQFWCAVHEVGSL